MAAITAPIKTSCWLRRTGSCFPQVLILEASGDYVNMWARNKRTIEIICWELGWVIRTGNMMGLAGLLLERGAFPSTSLGDSKLGTNRDVPRATNTEQTLSWLGKGCVHNLTTLWEIHFYSAQDISSSVLCLVAPFYICSAKSSCPSLCLVKTIVVECSFCVCSNSFPQKVKQLFTYWSISLKSSLLTSHLPFSLIQQKYQKLHDKWHHICNRPKSWKIFMRVFWLLIL